MITLPGYEIRDKIHNGKKTLVYRGYRDNKPFIIKILRKEYPSNKDIARFEREYEIVRTLDFDGVVQAFELLRYQQHSLALIFEDFGGIALDQWLTKPINLEEFFPIALSLIETLGKIHHSNIIHKDIKPANIIIHPQTHKVKVTDFGISSLLPRENLKISHPKLLEGTLSYMSPEQTGWMKRELDYRSDFYSLGVTFYEMLSKEIPFITNDTMELIHCHIAKPIPCLTNKVRNLPIMVSKIISKLLSKNAENRYLSCRGLYHDLEKCFLEWKKNKDIPIFPLAQKEVLHKFQMSEKIFGREEEISCLLKAFERTSQGAKELISVTGYAGIGKSKLISEVYKQILEKRGFFVQGKFEQLQKRIPYSALLQAIEELVGHILAEGKRKISQWKNRIIRTCGEDIQTLLEIIPQLKLIVGPTEYDLRTQTNYEIENRFHRAFTKFLQIFAETKQPVVLFLDDLQWADPETLYFIQFLLSSVTTKYILIIIAYREKHIKYYHPLEVAFENIRKKDIIINELHLKTLKEDNLNCWIKESLLTSKDTKKFTSLILNKTRGNPFFVKEFMTALYINKFLEFRDNFWEFHLEKIQKMKITENVVDLLCSRIKKLSPEYQSILETASCIGSAFDTLTLSVVMEKPAKLMLSIFNKLITQGFIFSQGNYNPFLTENFYFQFSHDKVQQAVYSMIEEERRSNIHLKIGRFLLKNTIYQKEDILFDIVNHMNKAQKLVNNEEKKSLISLNLEAGTKSMLSTAYIAAASFLETSRLFLAEDSWDTDYDLTFKIYSKEAECQYLNGNFEKSQNLFDHLLKNANNRVKIAQIYITKITLLINQGKHLDAISLGQEGLKLFHIYMKNAPITNKAVLIELIKVQFYLYGKKPQNFMFLPEIKREDKLIVMNLLMSIAPSTFFVSPNFFAYTALKMLHLTLKYGNSNVSPFAYVCYGMIIGSGFGRYQTGYEFGELAIALSKANKVSSIHSKTLNLFGSMIRHWCKPVKDDLDYLMNSYTEGLKCGDLMFACFSLTYVIQKMIVSGKNLNEISAKAKQFIHFSDQIKYKESSSVFQVYQKMIDDLQKPLPMAEIDHSLLKNLQNPKNTLPLHWYYISRMQVFYLFGLYEKALAVADKSSRLTNLSKGTIPVSEHYFYYSLILIALYNKASQTLQKKYRRIIKVNQKKMKKWVCSCEENFHHKYILVEAEKARASNEISKATLLYDQAIELAQRNEYTQDAALANELAGEFYLFINKRNIAKVYFKEAHYNYKKWGATSKFRELEEKYPFVLSHRFSVNRDSSIATFSTTIAHSSILNIATVLKASQLISQEILLDKLLHQLIRISLENAGAQKGFLMIAKKGNFFIEAQGAVDEDVTVCQSKSVEESQQIAISIVNYVATTKKEVVLKNASTEGKFTQDAYIIKNNPKSIMCIPIIKLEKLIGIFYLENNYISNAFTADRLEVLQILTSQAAISIENALLYENTKKNKEMLKDKERKYRLLMEQASDSIFIFDLQGKDTDVNSKACEMLGYSKNELRSLNMEEILLVSEKDINKILAGETLLRESLIKQKNSDLIPVEMSVKTIDDSRIQAIVRDITERKRLEKEILEISEREKQRVAQDLHDSFGQHLIGTKFIAEALNKSLIGKSMEEEAKDAKRISFFLEESIEKARRLAHGLHPLVIEKKGILEALQQLAEDIQDLYKIECVFKQDNKIRIYNIALEIELYRIAQEAVNNAIKHGKANKIVVSLYNKEGIILSIEDDGCGSPEICFNKSGLGMRIMEYRARVLRASFKVEQNQPQGIRIICSIYKD